MTVSFADWRAQVEHDLAGKPFEKSLVHLTAEGIAVEPLYTVLPKGLAPLALPTEPFRICMRHHAGATTEAMLTDADEGAGALWLTLEESSTAIFSQRSNVFFVVEPGPIAHLDAAVRVLGLTKTFALVNDPIATRTRGGLEQLGAVAKLVDDGAKGSTSVMVSTLSYHAAGSNNADELAIALSTGAAYLGAMIDAGLNVDVAARQVAFQISVGRDTFLELSKLRALRVCWAKVVAAFGASETSPAFIHAVCSPRTLSLRDPPVNMLRVTTQVFAGILGGAQLVTPNAFDEASRHPSLHGRRVARNTGLVLREESHLGEVADPAAGSYAIETLTDAMARAAWSRFREFEKHGGIVHAIESGHLAKQLEASWQHHLSAIETRRLPILGVSEFATLDEPLIPAKHLAATGHRDSETFEALHVRDEVNLVTLGSFAECRARVSFAENLFASGGARTIEVKASEVVKARIACVCGPDDQYASRGVEAVRALKASGVEHVLLAGRPGPNEAALREAGVEAFIFIGCNAVAVLKGLEE